MYGKSLYPFIGVVDLTVLLQMPEMSGIEATEVIRKESQNKKVYIIGLTANVMEGNTQRCLQAGMNAVLSKPIQKDKLKKVLLKCSQPMYL